MRVLILTLLLFLSGCSVEQPESIGIVSAYEIQLASNAERTLFLQLITEVAREEGLHVDADSDRDLARIAGVIPEAKMTIHAAIWRDDSDEQLEATISDHGHPGRAWIIFLRGQDVELASRFRQHLIEKMQERYPQMMRSVPVMPTGALPLAEDMHWSDEGYKVDAMAAGRYGLAHSSSLVVRNVAGD